MSTSTESGTVTGGVAVTGVATTAQRVRWSALDDGARQRLLQRPGRDGAQALAQSVGALIDEVRAGGDVALRAMTARLDGVELDAFEVDAAEFAAAEAAVPATLREAMARAAARIEAFHAPGGLQAYAVETAPGVVCERLVRPITRVGLYVPAGSAPLPSTALMLGVPARLAGCQQVVLCTPPRRDGSADPAVLVAARMTGVHRVFKLGGAQAIAAMALGTAQVPACDKVFGPGNAWVTEAKRQLAQAGDIAIDLPAGPSEVLVIADAGANPDFIAADLLSQAEHGPDSQVLLVSDAPALIDAVDAALARQLGALPRAGIARQSLARSRLVEVDRLEDAFALSNRYAPEHLILALREPRRWLDRVTAAGSIFLGDHTPEALGDYCSGTNHVLPTDGAAHAWSGVGVASFQKTISVQAATPAGIAAIGPDAVTIADAEGLQAHANAVRLRLPEARA